MGRRLMPHVYVAAALLFAAGFVVAPSAGAQETSGTPTAMEGPHPAHIHSGTCDTLGDVVHPLSDVTSEEEMMGTPMAGMDSTPMAGMDATPMAGERKMSTTQVEASLDDLLAAEHAINVHESAERIDVYIACGDITGTPEEGRLEVELQELNESRHSGVAVLTDNGDGTTTVDIMLIHADEMMGTPVP